MSMRHLWMADSKSLEEHITAPTVGKTEDKRLSIDSSSSRQGIWTSGTAAVDILYPRIFCDKTRWVDASILAVDGLGQIMPTYFHVKILRASSYDVTPGPESTLKKVKKRLARARTNAIPLGK
eukprot:6683073-Pyramimonas_sp.AAC.1